MASKMKKTQNEKILSYLAQGRRLTVEQAAKRFGVQRLSARIHELRHENGVPIVTTEVKTRTSNGPRNVTAYEIA